MKKIIAVLLCFATVFCFAACTKKPVTNEETTTAEPTGKPGEWVTNEKGEPQTKSTPYLVLDENGEPQTDENGKALTTCRMEIATYPPAPGETIPPQTQPPTVAPGNTVSNENLDWPAYDFMTKFPKAADKVAKTVYSNKENGKEQLAAIYINEMSYADFLAYIETCKKAGFTQYNKNTQFPETAQAGKSYTYMTVEQGLYVTFTYYTDEYPYRNCDLYISVANYDVGGVVAMLEGKTE